MGLVNSETMNEMVRLGMNVDRKKKRSTSVREYRRLPGKHGRRDSMRQKGRKSMCK